MGMYNLVPKKKAKVLKQQEKAGSFISLFPHIRPSTRWLSVYQESKWMPQTICVLLYNIDFSNDVYNL